MAGLYQKSINSVLYSPQRPKRESPNADEAKVVCHGVRQLVARFEQGKRSESGVGSSESVGSSELECTNVDDLVSTISDSASSTHSDVLPYLVKGSASRKATPLRAVVLPNIRKNQTISVAESTISDGTFVKHATQSDEEVVETPILRSKELLETSQLSKCVRFLSKFSSGTPKRSNCKCCQVTCFGGNDVQKTGKKLFAFLDQEETISENEVLSEDFGTFPSFGIDPEPVAPSTNVVSTPKRPRTVSSKLPSSPLPSANIFERHQEKNSDLEAMTKCVQRETTQKNDTGNQKKEIKTDETMQEYLNRFFEASSKVALLSTAIPSVDFPPEARLEVQKLMRSYLGRWTLDKMRAEASDVVKNRLEILESISELQRTQPIDALINIYSQCLMTKTNKPLWVLCIVMLELNQTPVSRSLSPHEAYIVSKYFKNLAK